MSIQVAPPNPLEILGRPDVARDGVNAKRRAIQGTYTATVTTGSGCGSCKEASSQKPLASLSPMAHSQWYKNRSLGA